MILLVVDDDPHMATVIGATLGAVVGADAHVVSAEDRDAARVLIEAGGITAAVVDVRLPGATSAAALDRIAAGRGVPVRWMSAAPPPSGFYAGRTFKKGRGLADEIAAWLQSEGLLCTREC